MNYKFQLKLPEELEKEFILTEVLLVKSTSVICSLKHKLPFSESCYILKVIPAKQYQKSLYERLSKLSIGGILTAVQEYHTKHFIYFIFPKLQSLSYLVKCGKMDFHHIKTLCSDIGKTLLSLHKAGIYHMDLAPENIYLNDEGHFILGDFSSARLEDPFQKNPFFTLQPTGSTKGFYPEEISAGKSPVNYDVYGFFMILFLLLHHGRTPEENQKHIEKNGAYNTGVQTDALETSSQFLSETLLLCKSVYLPSDFLEKNFQKLEEQMNEIKEQKTLRSFHTEIPDFENSLFCSFTETPEEQPFLSRLRSTLLPFEYLQKTKSNHLSIPQSFFSKEASGRPALYALLVLCGGIFLFSCYHTITGAGKQAENIQQVKANPQVLPASGISIPPASETKAPTVSPDAFPNIASEPAPAPGDFPSPTAIPFPSKKPAYYLKLSKKNLKNTSFLSEVKEPKEIQIIFADHNKFSTISSFLLFQNLKELYLNQNSITSISSQEIRELKHLELLDLSENKLRNISALRHLKNLKLLDLSGQNTLQDITSLGSIRTLEYLILSNTNAAKKEISYLKKKLPGCTILY